jgi:heterodisulfide reductase subunit A
MTEEKEAPRVGVFICHCGVNIGGIVNVPFVVEYSKSIPGVVYAEANLYTCSSDGIDKIKEAIKSHNLNRVVVASCTPRTHEPLFQSTCEEAGLNKYLFEMANIRDQCSWVHMHEPEAATEKAKTLVRMAVAKVCLLKPQEEPEIEITPAALVIGGGVSGLTSALTLAEQGFQVHLVEKQPELGGMLLRLGKLFPLEQESLEILKPKIEAVQSNPNIKVHANSRVKSVKGFIGNFDVEIESLEGGVDGLSVGTIIVATGADVLKPIGLYSYGEDKRVVTQLQLEEMLKTKSLEGVRTIVMIQCAGSRNEDRPYCSRICCNEALKNALLLKKSDASRDVYILYRDLQTYGFHYTSLESNAKRGGVKMIRYLQERPPQVFPEEDGVVIKVFTPQLGEEMTVKADLIVLSTPLIPIEDSKELSRILKVPLDSNGFFMEAHVKLRPLDFATDGIFVCGTAHSPKDVSESISQALGAASRASIPMARGRVRTAAITAEVDENRCVGCGVCVELCPYNAIQKDEKGIARVTSAVCKGCGVCGGSCPERAIIMHHFTNEQLEVQGLAALRRAAA